MKNRLSGNNLKDIEKIVFVVPCYNEENRISLEYFEDLISLSGTFWIFVNDGSTDKTLTKLENLCTAANTLLISQQNNLGKAKSVQNGLLQILTTNKGVEWIGFLDSDGAFRRTDIERVIQLADCISSDAIFSSRVKLAGRNIRRRNFRHLFGRLIATIFGSVWKSIPYDTQSGLKIFRNTPSIQIAISEKFYTRWFLDIELVLKIVKCTEINIKIWEEPLTYWEDVKGSKIGLKQVGRILIEVVYIYICLFRQKKFL